MTVHQIYLELQKLDYAKHTTVYGAILLFNHCFFASFIAAFSVVLVTSVVQENATTLFCCEGVFVD